MYNQTQLCKIIGVTLVSVAGMVQLCSCGNSIKQAENIETRETAKVAEINVIDKNIIKGQTSDENSQSQRSSEKHEFFDPESLSNVELVDESVELHRTSVHHDSIEEFANISYPEIVENLKAQNTYTEIPYDSSTGEAFKIDSQSVGLRGFEDEHTYLNDFTTGLINHLDFVIVDVKNEDEVVDIINGVWYNPELIGWAINKPDQPEGYCVYSYVPEDNIVGIEPYYSYDEYTNGVKQHEFMERQINIAEWGMQNTENIDEYAQYIVCYLKENCDYDYTSMDTNFEDRTAYGPIVNGVGICSGFQKAFQYLMQLAGYDSSIVIGDYCGILHAWNSIVDSNGNTVYIDSTTGVNSEASWDMGYDIQYGDKYTETESFTYGPVNKSEQ